MIAKFHLPQGQEKYQAALQEMRNMYTAIPEELQIDIWPARQGYLVSYKDGSARLMCAGRPELFRALSLLDAAMLEGKTSFFIEQFTPFQTRGAMVD